MESINYYDKYVKYKSKYLTLQNGGLRKRLIDTKYTEKSLPRYNAKTNKGKIMMGNDKKPYVSKPNKNGEYNWEKIKDMFDCKSAEEWYSQFKNSKPQYDTNDLTYNLDLAKEELLESKIYLLHIKWDYSWTLIDEAWYSVKKILSEKLGYTENDILDDVSVLFYTDDQLYFSAFTGNFLINTSVQQKDKQMITSAFEKYFGKSFSWPYQNEREAIAIELKKL